nr:unnamed protein product [Callosobruchus chinensis]
MFKPSAKLRSPAQRPVGSSRTTQRCSFQIQDAIFCAVAKNAGRRSYYTY